MQYLFTDTDLHYRHTVLIICIITTTLNYKKTYFFISELWERVIVRSVCPLLQTKKQLNKNVAVKLLCWRTTFYMGLRNVFVCRNADSTTSAA